jgi:hypothetical protein
MEPTNQGEAPKLSQVIQIDEGKIPACPAASRITVPPRCAPRCVAPGHSARDVGAEIDESQAGDLPEQAAKQGPSFLDELLNCEAEVRRSRYLAARLQLTYLPFVKTFEQFDFSFQPSLDERQIREQRSPRSIHGRQKRDFAGAAGSGEKRT